MHGMQREREREIISISGAKYSEKFQKGIWENVINHNEETDWIEIEVDLHVTTERLRKQIKKLSNWKSFNPNSKSTMLRTSSLHLLNAYFNSGDVPT